MKRKELFKKYYSRLMVEGLVKSLTCGLLISLGLAFIIALISYIYGFNPLWYVIGVGLGAIVLTTIGLFFVKFKPTDKKVAERIDRLGLEERLVTMLELEGDDSYIAKRQKDDATQKLSKVRHNSIKIAIPSTIIALIGMLAVFASSLTLVSTLSAKGELGYLPGFGIGNGTGSVEIYKVNYKVVGVIGGQIVIENTGGFIVGAIEQFVLRDEDASTVVAVADEGWFFGYWKEDERTDPERTDRKIQSDVTYTAVFFAIGDENNEGDGDGKQNGEPGEPANNEPGEPGDDGETEQNEDGETNDGGGANGRYEEVNYVIDGKTYYRDVIDQLYEIFESGRELTPQQRAMLEAYLKTIQ